MLPAVVSKKGIIGGISRPAKESCFHYSKIDSSLRNCYSSSSFVRGESQWEFSALNVNPIIPILLSSVASMEQN